MLVSSNVYLCSIPFGKYYENAIKIIKQITDGVPNAQAVVVFLLSVSFQYLLFEPNILS